MFRAEESRNSPMTWLGDARLFNGTVALVAVLVWFTGTNHCLLGFVKQPLNTAVSMSHCPDHSKKSGGAHDGASAMLSCCQGLQSPNFEVAKAKIAFSPVLVAIQLFAVAQLILPEAPRRILLRTEHDTGPPWPGSFVGTVLRRSLRENAPPLVS
jgi:hypothetical protein